MGKRTRKPYRQQQAPLQRAIRVGTQQREMIVLGNGFGKVKVPPRAGVSNDTSNYGYYFARRVMGVDDNGNTRYSPVFRVRAGGQVPLVDGLKVYAIKDARSGELQVIDFDFQSTVSAGMDPRQFNALDPSHKLIWLRNVMDAKPFAPATVDLPTTNITIHDYLFQWDGSLYTTGKGTADAVDLSTYIPSDSTKEAMLLVAMNPEDRTLQYIKSAERTATGDKYALSDIQTIIPELYDYHMPLSLFRLRGGTTTIAPRDWLGEVRQFINVPPPKGWPFRIDRHTKLISDRQQIVKGRQIVKAGGGLTIASDAHLVIQSDGQVVASAGTVEYTITTTDATVTNLTSIKIATNSISQLKVTMKGAKSDYSAGLWGYWYAGYRNASGTVSLIGVQDKIINEDSSADPTFDLSISGEYVVVTVTGVTSETWDWTATVETL